MKVKQIAALTALTLATGAVLAQEATDRPLTRAEVKQSVLAARAAGTLAHAGDVAPEEEMAYARAHPSTSTLSRSEVNATVLQARSAGTLAHAGSVAPEEEMLYAQAHPSTSTLTRAEVKKEVLEARANGTLVPAGEAALPEAAYEANAIYAKAPPTAGQSVASNAKK